MAKRLLDYRGVPDEERDALRAALDAAGIDNYELPPSAFGISAGSLWIRHDRDREKALALYRRFQSDRAAAARRQPPAESFGRHLRRRPLQVAGYLLAAVLILVLMFWPVAQLWA